MTDHRHSQLRRLQKRQRFRNLPRVFRARSCSDRPRRPAVLRPCKTRGNDSAWVWSGNYSRAVLHRVVGRPFFHNYQPERTEWPSWSSLGVKIRGSWSRLSSAMPKHQFRYSWSKLSLQAAGGGSHLSRCLWCSRWALVSASLVQDVPRYVSGSILQRLGFRSRASPKPLTSLGNGACPATGVGRAALVQKPGNVERSNGPYLPKP